MNAFTYSLVSFCISFECKPAETHEGTFLGPSNITAQTKFGIFFFIVLCFLEQKLQQKIKEFNVANQNAEDRFLSHGTGPYFRPDFKESVMVGQR